MPDKKPMSRRLLLATLPLLLTACASVSPPSSPPAVKPPAILPLATAARVSLVPTPSVCSPACSIGLTRERESLLSTPTSSALPASPASGSTTDYSLPLGKLPQK